MFAWSYIPVVEHNRSHRRIVKAIDADAFNMPPAPIMVLKTEFGKDILTRLSQALCQQFLDVMVIVGMNRFHGQTTDVLFRDIPENPLSGRACVQNSSPSVEQHDGVRALFHQGAKAFLAGSQCFLSFFVLGDVSEYAVEAEHALDAVSAGSNAVPDPAHGSVGPQNSVHFLFAGGVARLDAQDGFMKQRAVVVVDEA